MRDASIALLLCCACPLNTGGLGSNAASTSESGVDSTTDVEDDSSSSGSGTTSISTSSDGMDETSTSTASASTTDSSSSTGDPPPLLSSCAEILARDPAAPTGRHAIAAMDDGEPIDVHCEMELDEGGWTLIARSQGNASEQPFGWGESTGTVGDGDEPYSLDVARVGPTFTEILITRRMGFATPNANAYVVEVPPGFIEDFTDSQYQHPGARTVLGGCEPTDGPAMLRRVGYTSNGNHFFIRDNANNANFGLFYDGFRLNSDDCNASGSLNSRQGALFVR